MQMVTKLATKTLSANDIFLRRAKKVLLPTNSNAAALDKQYVASVAKNIEALGYTMSEALIERCSRLAIDDLSQLNKELIEILKKGKGAHQNHSPFYPNFPQQVMDLSQAGLYINSLLHYVTGGRYKPNTEPVPRPPLAEHTELEIIGLGTHEEFEAIFRQIASSNSSTSEQDKADISWFFDAYGEEVCKLLPETIPNRENKAYIGSLLIAKTNSGFEAVPRLCTTATDILRLAVALSDGDVSLAKATKFRSLSRKERRALMAALEAQNNILEDMNRWKGRWIRLGEILHPGEYKNRFPECHNAFHNLRTNAPVATFNSRLELALENRVKQAPATSAANELFDMLKTRPGDFARRLDHVLRISGTSAEDAVLAFGTVAYKVSTPVLLQVMHHFKTRRQPRKLRVFFPKGEVAKAQGIPNELPELSQSICDGVAYICERTLTHRFSALPPLGKCYVDPALKNFIVPFSQRSASKSLRTITRGSTLPLPDGDTLRFFIWWKNGKARTDIDLSAAMFDDNFCFKGALTYYNLKDYAGHHSGDIVDAPNGASEFIDVSKSLCMAKGVRYIVMALNSFTRQPYCDLPECFAGWMARKQANSGEVYEPTTVKDKLDIAANARIAIPAMFDLHRNEVIWTDISMTRNPNWYNNVAGNLYGFQLSLMSMTDINKPSLYDLLILHAKSRGEQVDDPTLADTVFSVDNDTPFSPSKIASEFMANK